MLLRWMVLVMLGLLFTACGGGGGGGGAAPAPDPYPVSISSPTTDEAYQVDSATLTMSGVAFVPADSACQCTGLACFFGHGTLPAGYQVRCTNLTTGDTGFVSFYLNCLLQVKVIWNTSISLVPGVNLIQMEAEDAAGNTGLATLEVTRLPDVIAPQVSRITPANGATDIGLNASALVLFNETMDPASIDTSTLLLNDANGAGIATSVTPGAAANSWTLTPSIALSYATNYRITVSVGVRDLAGNPLAAPVTADFATLVVPDLIPPAVVAVSPPDGSNCAGFVTPVVVTFNEYIDVDTLQFTLTGPNGLPVAGYVSHQEGTYSWTFAAYDGLDHSAAYTAGIAAGLQDFSGNVSATPFSWTFSTSLDSVDYCP
jgi:hypothetical protein